MYYYLYFIIILLITLSFLPKIIEDKGLYGVCSKRYSRSKRLFIPTRDALCHFIQGIVFVFLLGIAPFIENTYIRYLMVLIGAYFAVLYPIYNYVKRIRIKNIDFRDTSYYNNLFDFQCGMWIGLVITFIICFILLIYNLTIYTDLPMNGVIASILGVTICILCLSIYKFYRKNSLCNYLYKKEESCTEERKNNLCPSEFRR